MASQQERTASSRQRLLDASRLLAAERGFAQVSVEEIGSAAGMSRGAVNYAFGSKAALFDELIHQQADAWSAFAGAGPAAASVAAVVDAHWRPFTGVASNARLVLMLTHEALGPSPQTRPAAAMHLTRLRDYVCRRVERLQRDGRVGLDVDCRAAATLIVGAALGLMAQLELEDFADGEADAAYRELLATFDAQWPSGHAGERRPPTVDRIVRGDPG